LSVLDELGAVDRPIITVFNKIDIADPAQIADARRLAAGALFVSARTRAGLPALVERFRELCAGDGVQIELLVPPDRYDLVARLQRVGRIHKEEHLEDGVLLSVQYPPAQSGFFAPYIVKRKGSRSDS
jgi:GTP-binding protein HflX